MLAAMGLSICPQCGGPGDCLLPPLGGVGAPDGRNAILVHERHTPVQAVFGPEEVRDRLGHSRHGPFQEYLRPEKLLGLSSSQEHFVND